MSTLSAPVFADPASIVNQLQVEPGSDVADFGCGSGFFSFEFAKRVGSEGRVYALDILPSALEAVASSAKSLGLTNVFPKRVNLEKINGSGIPPGNIDWIIIKDILFQNKDKNVILGEVARVLKPGGHALIMEWDPNESLVGPDKNLRIKPEQLKKLVEDVHLSVDRELSVGGFHYAFLIRK
ncbi:MAG: methyltransferase domain-containing protein [Candidatus Moraniibacteriota bacterium]